MTRLIATLCLLVLTSVAQSQTTRPALFASGDIQLPIPQGYVEPGEVAPVLRKNAESLTAPAMRLLAVFVADADVQAVKAGVTPAFRRYFMVQVLRAGESAVLSKEAFADVKQQVAGLDRATADQAVEGVREHMDAAAKNIGTDAGLVDLKLTLGVPRQLGVFHETDASVSTLLVTRAAASNGNRNLVKDMALATSTVLLRGKVIFFAAYSQADTGEDYQWLRSVSQAWIESAIAANPP